jgi:translocation and assembly module TamB
MDHPKYDLNLVAEGFHAVGSSAVDVTSSGRLHISGTSLEPVVEGRLEILRADVYLGDLAGASEVEGINLSEEDYRELARVFGYRRASDTPSTGPSLFDSATLNLDVGLRRDSWIRKRSNPEMAIQLTGDLTVSKEPGDSIRLVGEVDPVPERSYVQQFGRRFSLAGGSLVFQGSPRTARVDLTAEYAVPSRDNPDQPEVTISLEVTGTPEELNLELSSNPPLEASDMVSYLAVRGPSPRREARWPWVDSAARWRHTPGRKWAWMWWRLPPTGWMVSPSWQGGMSPRTFTWGFASPSPSSAHRETRRRGLGNPSSRWNSRRSDGCS